MAEDSQSRPSWLWGVTLALGALLLLALAHLVPGLDSFLDSLEAKSLDGRFLLSHGLRPGTQDRGIVIVAVDQNGLDFFEYQNVLSKDGRASIPWPWPRRFYGYLVRHFQQAGARAVFFDFIFNSQSHTDRMSGFGADEAIDDPAFAEACREAGNVYQSLLLRRRDEQAPSPVWEAVETKLAQTFPRETLSRFAIEAPPGLVLPHHDQVDLPLPIYMESAKGLGVVNPSLDADGILRHIALFYRLKLAPPYAPEETILTLPSIHWALARGLKADLNPPWDEKGEIVINWHGEARTYRHLPAHEIIYYENERAIGAPTPPLDPAVFDFKDKIVLVGTTATGLYDLKSNPFTREYPGVEAHATVIDNLINQDFVTRPGVALRLGAVAALFLIAGLLLVRPMPISASIAVILLLLSGYLGLAFYLFHGHRLWIDAVHPAIGLLVVFAGAQSFHYFTEGKRKRAIRSAFQRYLPPTVVAEVLKVPPDQLKLGGDRRELTVHFSDIQNFTHISESLEPEMLVKMLNVYLGEMSDIIAAHHGTLDKYIGDCVMAFWGAPLPLEGGALHACQAALEEQARLKELNRRFAAEGRPLLFARIGINTGPMLVGNMGSDQHFAYTVMGDAVNLASRLEGTNKEYGTYNMLGPLTYERAQEHIEARELDLIRVKGKAQPVRIYELLSEKGKLDDVRKRCRDRFAQGLKLYRERAWKESQDVFSEIFALNPEDGPALTYRDRALYYQEFPPPEDWDGVYTMKTK